MTEPYSAPAAASASSWECTYVAIVNRGCGMSEPLADHCRGHSPKVHQGAAGVPGIVEPDDGEMGTGRRGSGAVDDRAHFVTDHVHHESSHGTAREAKRCSALGRRTCETCY
jgi:hypothetical protein